MVRELPGGVAQLASQDVTRKTHLPAAHARFRCDAEWLSARLLRRATALGPEGEGPKVAGQQPSREAATDRPGELDLGPLGDLQRVVDLDPQIPDRALKLRVPKQASHSLEILGTSIDQRSLGAPQWVGAVGSGIQANRPHPRPDNPGILPGRDMRGL